MFGRKKPNVDKWLAAELEAEKLLDAAVEAEKLGKRLEARQFYKKAEKRDQEAQRYA